MIASLSLLTATLASTASAYIRFNCPTNLVEERADPVVNPGKAAGHVHKIAGGNGFGFTMDYDQARQSTCSTCPIKQDLSNYWTPKLYYQYPNGTFQSVPMVGDSSADLEGGMVVYYQQRPGPNNDQLRAFPAGFRMLAGNPARRNYTGGNDQNAVSFACLGANQPETHEFPNYKCPGGLRAQIYFPSCWDGKNLDSPDHMSHMAYPTGEHYDNGPCPASHPVHLVSLFFEPFLLSNGDTTGNGFHGDFVNGWDIDTLQAIVDQCNDLSVFGSIDKKDCPPIDQFADAENKACKLPPQINETVRGYLAKLPGCNPPTFGPALATPVVNCTVAPIIDINTAAAAAVSSDFTSQGWAYLGCASDASAPRTLTDKTSVYSAGPGKNMTIEWCLDLCKESSYAGLEYGSQCYCGSTLADDRAPKKGVLGNCEMPCTGDEKEVCGGSWGLSLYQKCGKGKKCENVEYSQG